jgi:hypothetical protein
MNVSAQGAGTVQVVIEDSTISGNFGSGFGAGAFAAGAVVEAILARNVIAGNGFGGVVASASSGGACTVVMDGNNISGHSTGAGITVTGSAALRTRQNNLVNYNSTPVSGSTTPHPGL